MNAPDISASRPPWQLWALDIGLAAIAVVPGVVNVLVEEPAPALTVTLLGVTAVVLCGRRRAPWAVLTVVAVLAAIGDGRSFTLAVCLAVFEVALRAPLGRAVLGYLLAVGVPLLGTTVKIMLGVDAAATGDVTPAIGVGTSIIDPYVVLAFAAGIVVQSTRQRRRAQDALLEQRIDSARALERARITAEMHDVVGHALTVMISLANGARSAWQTDPERSTQALTHLGEVGATALEDMQRTLRVLRDSDQELDDALHHSGYDLSDIDAMIEVFHTAGMPVTLRHAGDPIPESAMLHAAIHRIVQECLTNVLRYARGARTVEVSLDCSASAGTVAITVVDDGAPTDAQSLGTGRGLIGISERAASFGGSCAYGPRSPHGWAVMTTLRTEKPR
ncbi:Signal transduction histidine kinase [Plantibacter sp. VKM Ac-1784]|uniref:histidine kinase n=1 Tax=Plantibacter elymi (nom. nud.) TaxID=199708 RepID=A0ABY1RIZ1_9MICO|nr:histidine kinase [Plantibacter sp. VKM Ac-1784]SMQ75553.1 Signal transduction histidine kinase [Plantibacter sp. VKM Ac-1784]